MVPTCTSMHCTWGCCWQTHTAALGLSVFTWLITSADQEQAFLLFWHIFKHYCIALTTLWEAKWFWSFLRGGGFLRFLLTPHTSTPTTIQQKNSPVQLINRPHQNCSQNSKNILKVLLLFPNTIILIFPSGSSTRSSASRRGWWQPSQWPSSSSWSSMTPTPSCCPSPSPSCSAGF